MSTTTRDLPFLFRITHDQELLLRAILHVDETVRGRALDACREIDLEAVGWPTRRLLPLLASQVTDMEATEPLRVGALELWARTATENERLVRSAAELVHAWRRESVDAMVLKGAAVVEYLEGEWAARPMDDIDLAVHRDHLERALSIAAEEGWVLANGSTPDWLLSRVVPRRHSHALRRGDDRVDVHWHVLGSSIGPLADRAFWDGSRAGHLGGAPVRAPHPADLLLHVISHGARGSKSGHVRWLADAVHVLRSAHVHAQIDEFAERVAVQARAHSLATTVGRGVRTIHEITDEPRAAAVLHAVESTRPKRLDRMSVRDSGHASVAARELLRYGGGGEPLVRVAPRAARGHFELDLVRHPALYVAYAVAGHPALLGRAALRLFGSFAKTCGDPSYDIGSTLDLSDAGVAARHAGPGWSWSVRRSALRSRGREATLMVKMRAEDRPDVELIVVAGSTDGSTHDVDVRVNARAVASIRLFDGPPRATTIHIPARVAWASSPMEISFVGTRRLPDPRLSRAQIAVRTVALRPSE